MRLLRVTTCLCLLSLCALVPLFAKTRKLTVLGMLTEVSAIGSETTGWTIELNPVLMLDGKQISSIEVKSSNSHKLESLKDTPVEATGNLTYDSGVETGQRPILELSSIKPRTKHKIYIF